MSINRHLLESFDTLDTKTLEEMLLTYQTSLEKIVDSLGEPAPSPLNLPIAIISAILETREQNTN